MTSRPALAALFLVATSVAWANEPSRDAQVPTTPPEAPSPNPQEPAPIQAQPTQPTQPETYSPVTFSFDVAPGYRHSVFLEIPEDGVFELSVKNLESNPSGKWKPTAYVALVSTQCDVHYFLNLSVDTDLNQSYARIRLIDVKEKKELLNLTHQKLYELDHEFHVRAKLEGKAVHMYVDDELVDEREVPCEPEQIELGASSGRYVASLIEPIPPPSPE